MKKALIVGSRSQDGIFLKKYLLSLKYDVVGICRDYTEYSNSTKKEEKINILKEDHLKNFIKKEKPDEIYYFSAYNHSSESLIFDNKETLELANNLHFVSPMIFLQIIKNLKINIKFFYACSSHIFGNSSKYPQNELTQINPNSIYGITKASGLFGCRKFRNENIFASTGILYSHVSENRSQKFLSKKISSAVARIHAGSNEIISVGHLETLIDWGYAKDYVEAMHAILQLPNSDDFIISSGFSHTVKDFISLAFECVGLDYRNHIKVDKNLLKRNFNPLIGDSRKVQELTGWKPKTNFTELVNILVKHEIDSL